MPLPTLQQTLKRATAALAALLLALTAGCVERQETLDVQSDGTTTITLQFTADSAQELAQTATPSAAEGWKIDQSVREEKDGKKKYLLTATKPVVVGQALPAQDGPAAAADAALELHFPTTLGVDKRADGTYYLFRRTFEPRPYAQWNHIEERQANEQLGTMLKEKNNKLTAAEWQNVIRGQIVMQVNRKLELARAAFLQVTPPAPADQWLRVRNGVLEAGRTIDTGKLAELLQAPQTPERDRAIAQTSQNSEAELDAAIRTALADQGYNDQQRKAFDQAWTTLNRRNQITGQIEIESFIVRLHLPGQIIGSNATTQKDGTLEWRISGKQFMDRQVELLAASKTAP